MIEYQIKSISFLYQGRSEASCGLTNHKKSHKSKKYNRDFLTGTFRYTVAIFTLLTVITLILLKGEASLKNQGPTSKYTHLDWSG